MLQKFLLPDGVVTACQIATFLKRMTELQDRMTLGVVSPEIVLDGIQKIIEGKYPETFKQTEFGIFKLFGRPVKLFERQTDLGYPPGNIFKIQETEHAYMNHGDIKSPEDIERIISLFSFERGSHENEVKIAPYRFPKDASVNDIIKNARHFELYPKITLHHLNNLLSKNLCFQSANESLYEGKGGNFFLLSDKTGSPWFVWVWLHNDGQWAFRFIETVDILKSIPSNDQARIWLLAPSNN